MHTSTLADLCAATVQIVTETADFLRSELGNVQRDDIETKALNSLVSYVDKTAETKLVSQLGTLLPQSTFLTEEETVVQGAGEYRWIIDPLDGTTNFLHQLPIFSVSVALHHRNEPVLAVVYEVNRRECFSAWRGGGTHLNGRPVRVSNSTQLSETLIGTGFPYYDFGEMEQYLSVFRQLMPATRGIRRCGSAAVDLAWVACGRFDGFFEYSLQPWDMAAGVFLIQEAGGVVSDFLGGDKYLFGNRVVAGNPAIHQELVKLTKEFFG